MQKTKTVYGYRSRQDDNDEWSSPIWYHSKAVRDRNASYMRIIGGFRVWTFEEKMSVEEIEDMSLDGSIW